MIMRDCLCDFRKQIMLLKTNSVIKTEHTRRKQLPIGQFLNNLINLEQKWSESRDPTFVKRTVIY